MTSTDPSIWDQIQEDDLIQIFYRLGRWISQPTSNRNSISSANLLFKLWTPSPTSIEPSTTLFINSLSTLTFWMDLGFGNTLRSTSHQTLWISSGYSFKSRTSSLNQSHNLSSIVSRFDSLKSRQTYSAHSHRIRFEHKQQLRFDWPPTCFLRSVCSQIQPAGSRLCHLRGWYTPNQIRLVTFISINTSQSSDSTGWLYPTGLLLYNLSGTFSQIAFLSPYETFPSLHRTNVTQIISLPSKNILVTGSSTEILVWSLHPSLICLHAFRRELDPSDPYHPFLHQIILISNPHPSQGDEDDLKLVGVFEDGTVTCWKLQQILSRARLSTPTLLWNASSLASQFLNPSTSPIIRLVSDASYLFTVIESNHPLPSQQSTILVCALPPSTTSVRLSILVHHPIRSLFWLGYDDSQSKVPHPFQ